MRDLKWHDKNDVTNIDMKVKKKYTNIDMKECGYTVETIESHSDPLMIHIKNPKYPKEYLTGYIVKYLNIFTLKDGSSKEETEYSYRFYDLEDDCNSEISLNSDVANEIRWIYLFDNETEKELNSIIKDTIHE